MPSYAVTGAARGIELEFVAQLSADPKNTMFALVRNKTTATRLESLPGKNITILEADITDPKALEIAAKEVSSATGGKLDYLINNAALAIPANPADIEKDFIDHFRVNTVGTAYCINAFLRLLQKGSVKKVITISSAGGDADVTVKTSLPGYARSKAAVNMLVAKYAARFKEEGFVFLALTPGFVNTSCAAPTPAALTAYNEFHQKILRIAPGFKGSMTP
ncbi:hypothetical protein DFH07DRAFT_951488 [Mycena maculata]|uniref:NAD(P)-binding protein n=1 Tax=Mycena maculata TaxID=230809 RepID=A0AAD7K4A5_9AGAR|nr:hypothetical protein DFH07DRAFT_951488 [Mycena maculata]